MNNKLDFDSLDACDTKYLFYLLLLFCPPFLSFKIKPTKYRFMYLLDIQFVKALNNVFNVLLLYNCFL